jgi:hypothetical protein
VIDDVGKARDWTPPKELEERTATSGYSKSDFIRRPDDADAWVRTTTGSINEILTLSGAANLAKAALGAKLVAWWCDPAINLDVHEPPATFGRAWPAEDQNLHVDEVAFFAERAIWRAARTSQGFRFVLVEELAAEADGAEVARVVHTPARLHGFRRFSSNNTGQGSVLLREWHVGGEILGYTITKEQS